MLDFSEYNFEPVMDYPDELPVLDLSVKKDPDVIKSKGWAVGKYDEKREGMYTASHFEGRRNIHVGIDIFTSAGRPVFAFYGGEIAYQGDNNRLGDYGPTIVTRHLINGRYLYALHGHLSRRSLTMHKKGDKVKAGEQIAELGTEEENVGWVPHLHFQLSLEDPGEADMPGVVSPENHSEALEIYPDPRLVLGNLY